MHSLANPMHHEPCRLLSDADGAGHFIRANAILAAHDQPHCGKPLFKRNRGILENGSDLEREFLARVVLVALVQAGIGKILYFERAALRTAHLAIRPAVCNHELLTVLKVAEVLNGLLKCFWAFHAFKVSTERSVSQVYYCPNLVSNPGVSEWFFLEGCFCECSS